MKNRNRHGNTPVPGPIINSNIALNLSMHKPGDIITLEGTGDFADGVRCEVLKVDPVDGRVTKMKALIHDDRLGRMGFILEGEDWVAVEWDFCQN